MQVMNTLGGRQGTQRLPSHSLSKPLLSQVKVNCRCNAVNPYIFQDIIVGGAVALAVGSAVYSALKKDTVPCDLCQGTGGIKCFACDGLGKLLNVPLEAAGQKRDVLGRVSSARDCRVCGGSGLVLCRQCKGAGFTTPM